MKYHTTKDGNKIPISELTDSHLHNIIKWIERKSEDGIRIEYGGCWDEWYDDDCFYGDIAKDHLNYNDYINEKNKRKLLTK